MNTPCLTSFEAVLSSSKNDLKVVVRGVKDNNDGVREVVANDESIRVRFLSLSNVFKSNDDVV